MPRLGEQTWTAVEPAAESLVLAVPVGSTEQHGPHLPLSTDTLIAVALADRLAFQRTVVTVAPAVAYGASGEHAAFPGTISIGHDALRGILVELGRSADAFAGVVFVNGHGGNQPTVVAAVNQLAEEGRRAMWWSASWDGDAHAGRSETSLMLAIAKPLVRKKAAAAGDTRPIGKLIEQLKEGGVRPVSPNGVLGDPEGATLREGRALLSTMSTALVSAFDGWVRTW